MSAPPPAACDACLRRTALIAALAPFLALRGRRRPGELLALRDEELIAALAGEHGESVRRTLARFDPASARARDAGAGLSTICRHQDAFPPALLEAPDAPALLHVAGSPDRLAALLAEPVVVVVGARRASAYGLEVARALGRGLSAAGVTVVSGMAFGVDSAAHEGALAGGGRTIAVLAAGAERAYPRRKRPLYERIAAEAVVVSEMPPGFPSQPWAFPARNRIIAGLARMTVVVEAAECSGSLITATIAGDLGREVAAVPGQVTAPLARGTNALLADGALLVRDAEDVLDAIFGAAPRPAAGAAAGAGGPGAPSTAPLPPPLGALLDAVASGHDTVAALAARAGDLDSALAGLAELELQGRIRRTPGGRYVVLP